LCLDLGTSFRIFKIALFLEIPGFKVSKSGKIWVFLNPRISVFVEANLKIKKPFESLKFDL
jgi:hypothetical protein